MTELNVPSFYVDTFFCKWNKYHQQQINLKWFINEKKNILYVLQRLRLVHFISMKRDLPIKKVFFDFFSISMGRSNPICFTLRWPGRDKRPIYIFNLKWLTFAFKMDSICLIKFCDIEWLLAIITTEWTARCYY